jgi:hypothetical protein
MVYKIEYTDNEIISVQETDYSENYQINKVIDSVFKSEAWTLFYKHEDVLYDTLFINLDKYKNGKKFSDIDNVLNRVALYNRSKRIKSILK